MERQRGGGRGERQTDRQKKVATETGRQRQTENTMEHDI